MRAEVSWERLSSEQGSVSVSPQSSKGLSMRPSPVRTVPCLV